MPEELAGDEGRNSGWNFAIRALAWVLPLALGTVVALAVRTWTGNVTYPAPLATPAPWLLPDQPEARIGAARLPRYDEDGAEHIHTHLDVFLDGTQVEIPGGIGLTPPFAAVHTHSSSGLLHIETRDPSARVTLGQFFTVWGVRMSAGCVGSYCLTATPVRQFVNGIESPGNPADIVLRDGDQVVILIGVPPSTIPDSYDCANAADIEDQSCLRSFDSR